MNKKSVKNKIRRIICLLMMTIMVLTGCGQREATNDGYSPKVTETVKNLSAEKEESTTLTVAMFPYVPDVDYFEKMIKEKWESDEEHGNIKLEFVSDWDCYDATEIPDEYDIVVIDAIYLREYAEKGEILPIEESDINNYEDILPFVSEGIRVDDVLYGIPEMICANLFFYRADDTEVAEAGNVDALYEVMGSYEYDKAEPEQGKGLIVDMSSGTGNTCFYLDAITDEKAVYSDFKEMPDLNNIDERAIQSLNELVLMTGEKGAYYETSGSYDRAGWFGNGSGRAYIGYGESMAEMKTLDNLKVSTLSLADREDIPLFYSDVVAMNSSLSEDKDKQKYALELMNIMTDSDVVTKTIAKEGTCQYILPARSSCYTSLKASFPIYEQLETIVQKDNNKVFRMGADAHEYIKEAKKVLPYYLLGYGK